MWYSTLYDVSKHTIELGDLVKSGIDIWDFNYPSFYKGDDKKAFEQKVIDHYRFRQIGQETPARFLHMFRSRIRDIMPYYIQLYESEKYMKEIEDPFATVDYTETFEQTATDNSTNSITANSTTSTDGLRKFSNTPQGSIDNIDRYMTEANKESDTSNGSSKSSGTSNSSGTVKHTLTKKGAMGVTTFGHDMIEYRQSFRNIDLEVINELNDLFLGVY